MLLSGIWHWCDVDRITIQWAGTPVSICVCAETSCKSEDVWTESKKMIPGSVYKTYKHGALRDPWGREARKKQREGEAVDSSSIWYVLPYYSGVTLTSVPNSPRRRPPPFLTVILHCGVLHKHTATKYRFLHTSTFSFHPHNNFSGAQRQQQSALYPVPCTTHSHSQKHTQYLQKQQRSASGCKCLICVCVSSFHFSSNGTHTVQPHARTHTHTRSNIFLNKNKHFTHSCTRWHGHRCP